MKTISSRQNPEIKNCVTLKKKKERHAQGKFIAEGETVCATLCAAGWQPQQLYVTQQRLDIAQKMVADDIITLVTTEVMEKISQAHTPSGIVGLFQLPKTPQPERLSSGIVLVNVADPGNMGTLIRTCVAMGCTSVVVVDGADPWAHKVVQASAGAVANVDIFSWSWEKLLQNKGNKRLVALVVQNGTKLEKIDKKNSLLVIGNEAHGIPTAWAEQCDERVTLPMPGKIESLNAAVAGSIALYVLHTG